MTTFQQMADNMAVSSGGKLLGPTSKFEVKDHAFARADFERSAGGMRIYQGYVQTLSEDYLLAIEIYATSAEELQKIGDTLQTMVIADE